MSQLPREARDGLMRAWLDILRERHPEMTWIPAQDVEQKGERGPVSERTELTLVN
jgi:hypothetical protein